MSNTPRTDKNYIRGFEALYSRTLDEDEWVRAEFARRLETELAEARQQLVEASIKFKELDHEFGCEHRLYLGLKQKLIERDALIGELADTELKDIACAGSMAPVEDILGRLFALTPSSALAKHDAEVRRKVLEEAADILEFDEFHDPAKGYAETELRRMAKESK